MLEIDALIDRLRRARTRSGLSKVALARKADNLHKNTLLHFDDPDWSPSVETVRRLERALADELKVEDASMPSGGSARQRSRRPTEDTTGEQKAA